jgi:hypothetical protein
MNAAMRRKDFAVLATALRFSLLDPASEVHRAQHFRCCVYVADALQREYAAFDRERFLRDCGVQP